MAFNFASFDHEKGDAWGNAPKALEPGEYNVTIAAATYEQGVLKVQFTATEPAVFAGQTAFTRFTLDAAAAGHSAKAEEIGQNRLRGMLRAAQAPTGVTPARMTGLALSIEIQPQRNNPEYTEIKRFGRTTPSPFGQTGTTQPPNAPKFSDDDVPF